MEQSCSPPGGQEADKRRPALAASSLFLLLFHSGSSLLDGAADMQVGSSPIIVSGNALTYSQKLHC
jgi:hypothetical protein